VTGSRDQGGGTRMFVTAVPGLGALVGRELERLPATRVHDTGFDGRADVILLDSARPGGVLRLRLAEDVFVEVGRTLRSDGDDPRWISQRIWRPERLRRALSVWTREVRPLPAKTTFRVIARVVQERSFLRTDLRRNLTSAILWSQPRWKTADPGVLEVWITEYRPGRFVAGLRLSDARMRQHDGRDVERPGALRPTVAAAMVQLAGPPGLPLLDPCCGSGTILREALARGWEVFGVDSDPAAVTASRRNASGAEVRLGDARALPFAEASIGACVCNPPFGQQYQVPGDADEWLRSALTELARVTRPGGCVLVLAPEIPGPLHPRQLSLAQRYPIRLLGRRATIWAFSRRAG
jgi:23S rRNA G2445 N2-methylase RlmL